jgi:hypothetical protein
MKRLLLGMVFFVLLFLPASAQFNGCSAGFCAPTVTSGGSPSYAFQAAVYATPQATGATSYTTGNQNFGVGSPFILAAVASSNAIPATVKCNTSFSLTLVEANASGTGGLYGGNCTTNGSTDNITITTATNSFDVGIIVWSMSNLNSTTAQGGNTATSSTISSSTSLAAGVFVFSENLNAGTYTGSSGTVTNHSVSLTGIGTTYVGADATVGTTGTYTYTSSAFANLTIAGWH